MKPRPAIVGALALCAAALAPSAHAAVTKITPEYGMSYFGTPGPVEAEGGAGTGQWVWYVDSLVAPDHSFLHRFEPAGGSTAEVSPFFGPPYTDPEGEIGHLSDLLYDPISDLMFMADETKNRILWYQHESDPPPASAFDQSTVGQMPGPVSDGDQGAGTADGEFSDDIGTMAMQTHPVDGRQLLIADTGNNRVQVFNASGSGLTHAFNIPTIGAPLAVTVDSENEQIWVSQSGSSNIAIYDVDGNFVTGFTPPSPNGLYDDIEYNPFERVVYASQAATLDIFSTRTYSRLGMYMFPEFSEPPNMPGDTGTRMIDSFALEASTSNIHVVTFNPDTPPDNGNPAPAQVFATSIWPTCTIAPAIDVAVGQSIVIEPSCDDADGAPVQEFTLGGTPTLGTAEERPALDAIDYTAPATGGQTNVPFYVTTMNGRSQLYLQPVNVVAPAADPPPAPLDTPTYRDDSNLSKSTGEILIQLPGTNTFVPLEKDAVVPLGTVVDATKGEAVVTWAKPDGTTYSAKFWAGIFEIKQTTGANPVGEVVLRDDLVKKAAGARATTAAGIASAGAQFEAWIAAKKKGKRKNRVWGDGKGKFRSSGNNSSASVRGTVWLVENYVNATRTYVRSGVVDVRDKRKRKTIRLKRGKSYVAYRR